MRTPIELAHGRPSGNDALPAELLMRSYGLIDGGGYGDESAQEPDFISKDDAGWILVDSLSDFGSGSPNLSRASQWWAAWQAILKR